MADTKISGLTSLTGADVASATDVLPIVDTSVTTTKKITRAQLFDISDSGGGQIVFPATQNASAGANTLDDYEEGSFTPTITFDTAGDLNVVYSTQTGFYTKIGRQVFFSINIQTSTFTHSTASGNLNILWPSGPTCGTNNTPASVIWQGIIGVGPDITAQVASGTSTTLNLLASSSGDNITVVSAGFMPSAGTVILRISGSFNV